MEIMVRNTFMPQSTSITVLIFIKLMLAQQLFLKNFYTEFHKNLTNTLVSVTRSQEHLQSSSTSAVAAAAAAAAAVAAARYLGCTKVLQIRTQMAQIDPPSFLLLAVNDRMMVVCVVISLNYTRHFLGLLKKR
jgi:hypothetical protein